MNLVPRIAAAVILLSVAPACTDAGASPASTQGAMSKTQSISASGYDVTPLPKDTVKGLAAKLDPAAYAAAKAKASQLPAVRAPSAIQ